MARAGDGIGERFSGDACDGLFACGVDVEKEKRVCIAECGGEFFHEIAGASIAMRLKNDMNAFEAALPCGGESGADLCGVMSVIVNDADSANLAFELEAAIDSTKFFERATDVVWLHVEADADGDGSSRVQNVVHAGNE